MAEWHIGHVARPTGVFRESAAGPVSVHRPGTAALDSLATVTAHHRGGFRHFVGQPPVHQQNHYQDLVEADAESTLVPIPNKPEGEFVLNVTLKTRLTGLPAVPGRVFSM